MEGTDKSLAPLKEAKALVVNSKSARQMATDLWDAIRAFRKQAEDQKEKTCRPLKDQWDNAKKPYDSFIKECQHHEAVLQQKMTEYDLEQDRLIALEQKKLQEKVDKANAKIAAKAEAKGVVPIFKETPTIESSKTSMETQAGTVQTRQVKLVRSVIPGQKSMDRLRKDCPQLFVFSPVEFNKVAKTGVLDNHPSVKVEKTFVYAQRQGNQIPIEEDGGDL